MKSGVRPSAKRVTPAVLKSSALEKLHSAQQQHDQQAAIGGHIESILKLLGEDTDREGLVDTPKRYAKAMQFLTSGYSTDVDQILKKALFTAPSSEMVIVRDIELFSMCEHHLLPFWGRAHIGYIPNGKIIGLSKLPRLVDAFARRLQVQERLTTQVSETLMKGLQPMGVAVIVEAYHMCMMMRGVAKQNSYTVTSSMTGIFHDDPRTRQEFLTLLKAPKSI